MEPQHADTPNTFTIQTEVFNGPLDVLLSLIEKRKLFINDISLSKVADDYLSYVDKIEQFPVAQTAQFLLVASTLVLIKSKSLLPTLQLTEEEQESVDDLEQRLKIYKRIKELGEHVKAQYGSTPVFERSRALPLEPVFSPDETVTVEGLRSAMQRVREGLPRAAHVPQASVKKVVSLEQMVDKMTERIRRNLQMSFKQLASERAKGDTVDTREVKQNVIVSFLALLELVKRGSVHVRQDRTFDEIAIESSEVDTPQYG